MPPPKAAGSARIKRFAFPAKPEVGIEIAAVEVVPEFPDHFPRIAERTEEGDLRYPVPLALHPVEDAAEGLPALGIGDLVGDVEDDHVDVGVGQHLGVLAEDALIVRDIIAEDRLAPVMRRQLGAPERAPRITDRGRVLRQDLRDVEGPQVARLAQPQEVKDPDVFVRPRRADFLGHGQSSAPARRSPPRYHSEIARLARHIQSLDRPTRDRPTRLE